MVPKLQFIVLLFVLCEGLDVTKLKLKQVLIFGRHNVRYPLGEFLPRFTAKSWPVWRGQRGDLTPKGAHLEGYIGEYFRQWFNQEQFLPEGCPGEDTVYAFTNSINRTKATARAFLDSMFKGCNVPVYHRNISGSDPMFTPIIRNTTEEFREKVLEEVNRKLQERIHKLIPAFREMNKILEIESSDICKKDGICDLSTANNTISYIVGKEMWVEGPLFITNSVLDSFTMSYYDGLPLQNIAWGQVTTPEKWQLLTEITRQDHYIRYTTVAKDIGGPLMKYLSDTFKNFDKIAKLVLMIGHDYNMNSIANNLGFEEVLLPNQFEKYPIGGSFVFQRWTDGTKDYLKVEHVYPSWSQLRLGTKLSLEYPPEIFLIRLNWCNTDENGFCPWTDFINKLDS
ncbi:hypothetical protein B5X24_HaOG204473 [Helicoverpa armigera]|uniref:2-phosphoxylose phosphatase 1 n=1 Tax=Helicoverpa armigera TaxID=29058 RepID=A0A2W1BNH9_HELAM|nr:hypothetical protein B5X24_HaOG204473 [Helicoverpa armigera]